jgi:hypothetical protein
MSKKNNTFASEIDYEPTALAYTDFTKPMPILEGEDAERFLRIMEENERKAKERAKIPMTLKEAESKLSCSKIILQFEKDKVKELEQKIEDLEKYIKNLNGEK